MVRIGTTLRDLFLDATDKYGALRMNWTLGNGDGYTYSAFRSKCEEVSSLLSAHGIGEGNKVAIYSTGIAEWSIAFFSATAFGRVAVPILPDFTGIEAEHVIDHSEAKALFVSEKQRNRLDKSLLERLDLVIAIETMEVLHCSAEPVPAKEADYSQINGDTLASIIYTSGTTGSAKGVMLTHRNFLANLDAGIRFYPLNENDVMLSILPLAHAYELSLGMLYPFSCGSSVCYVGKVPTPSILLKAMKEVRPTAMLSVPLIIEKVYKGKVLQLISHNPLLSWMDRHMNKLLCLIIGKKMINTFGGRLKFFGIGGAKLDRDVEAFLKKARFPYRIGYGLTECAPLLALCHWYETTPGQIGKSIYGVQLRLDNVNPDSGEGEIVAKGDNIFPGYYKDPERTAQAFTEDGWFRTGDLASVDSEGRYAIKGRIGNMIVGASGENIYPEEIEKVVKDCPDVEDAIVIGRGKRLVCLVKATDNAFNVADAANDKRTKAAVAAYKENIMSYVNARVNAASRLSSVEVMTIPFEKTATMKIRRFLYKDSAPTI